MDQKTNLRLARLTVLIAACRHAREFAKVVLAGGAQHPADADDLIDAIDFALDGVTDGLLSPDGFGDDTGDGWVSCQDRMPSAGQTVLAVMTTNDNRNERTGVFTYDPTPIDGEPIAGWWSTDAEVCPKVSRWRTLPPGSPV